MLSEKYSHIQFRKHWEISANISFLLGECCGYVKAIANSAILPEYFKILLKVSLKKGALATTAIEGNTLTEQDLENIEAGISLPPSKEYLEIEVRNIITAFNILFNEIIEKEEEYNISKDLLLRFHTMVGKDLGVNFDAIPGTFRRDNRSVSNYRCPEYTDVEELVEKYCHWLAEEFHYTKGQSFTEKIIQAIVAHVYLEWIHPFADGNGRTGRLVEFYILIRGGVPNIASHILSNHYNNTRSEYYRQLDIARRKRDLTDFIQYAVLGFRDGLKETLDVIQENQAKILWSKLIYDKFSDKKTRGKEVYRRRRKLALEFPLFDGVALEKIIDINVETAKIYSKLSKRTLYRDLEELLDMEILEYKNSMYSSRIAEILQYMPTQKDSNLVNSKQ